MPEFYEMFAGGGMARMGFGPGWRCVFANDISPMKGAAYAANWGADHLHIGDIAEVAPADLPGRADAVWASFPCQDVSLAGAHAGLGAARSRVRTRSGAFWPFWSLMRALAREGRGPRAVVLENVYGAITSNRGRDFAAIASAFSGAGYRFGAMVIDARQFTPQSRPRLFFVGFDPAAADWAAAPLASGPTRLWHPERLVAAQAALSSEARRRWLWIGPPAPETAPRALADLIEDAPRDVAWHGSDETDRLVSLMSAVNRAKLERAAASGARMAGTLYRRTRVVDGVKTVRAEVRFDGLAGCLRTPAGGSSRQFVVLIDGGRLRTRLMSSREAARLMGLDDSYVLPERYNDAYHVAGDGVVAPVVRHLVGTVIEPALGVSGSALRPAA